MGNQGSGSHEATDKSNCITCCDGRHNRCVLAKFKADLYVRTEGSAEAELEEMQRKLDKQKWERWELEQRLDQYRRDQDNKKRH
jgi:hypothetical protein